MSSGFVSGGTTEEPKERDQEWLDAQRELEAERQRKAEEGQQAGGKSLYEVLQQNKAAKQEAFEESIRLKNQFRTLDEDEVEFLDSLLESTRAKEAALKKETTEQLEVFHRQRELAEKAVLDGGEANDPSRTSAISPTEEEQWSIPGRKRRRPKQKDALPGVKLRKSSSTDTKSSLGGAKVKLPGEGVATSDSPVELHTEDVNSKQSSSSKQIKADEPKPGPSPSPIAQASPPAPQPPASSALGLGAYDSDDD